MAAPQPVARARPVRLRVALALLLALPALIVCAGGDSRNDAGRDPARDVPRREQSGLERVALARVVDGDTLDVTRNGHPVRVRLLGVDTEERLHATALTAADAPQTVFGEETALWLAELLAGTGPLGLLLPGGRERRDDHGRLLAHLALADGRDLNVLLVRLGRSPYFQRYGPSELDHAGFERAQNLARRERLGIWDPRTNQPRHPGAPRAQRDYPRLLAWWQARAAAVRAFGEQRLSDGTVVLAADRPEELERAARLGGAVRIFAEVEGAQELESGALLVFLAAPPSAPGLRLLVPAALRPALAGLDLAHRGQPGRQSFVWIEGCVRARSGHWWITLRSAEHLRLAGPEPSGG